MAASLCWGSATYSFYGLLETLETLGLPLLLLIEVPESLSHMLRLLSCCSTTVSAGSIKVDSPTTRGPTPVHAGLGGTPAGCAVYSIYPCAGIFAHWVSALNISGTFWKFRVINVIIYNFEALNILAAFVNGGEQGESVLSGLLPPAQMGAGQACRPDQASHEDILGSKHAEGIYAQVQAPAQADMHARALLNQFLYV